MTETYRISVLIPSWRRTDSLTRCLTALSKQTLPASEVVVVIRKDDIETDELLSSSDFNILPIRRAYVERPGQTAALNAGLSAVRADIVAITDDDTAPHNQWLERIATHFSADPKVGGVGGRDWVYHNGVLDDGQAEVVGRIQWFGRYIGNHHIGVGAARQVDMLKGANMSYRWEAIKTLRFDETLLGDGAQIHNDMAFSLSVKHSGWKLIYDPLVAVDHFPGARYSIEKRNSFNSQAWTNYIHNQTRILLTYHIKGLAVVTFILWSGLMGTREAPGFLQFIRLLLLRDSAVVGKIIASFRGRLSGIAYCLKTSKKPSPISSTQ